MLSLWSFIVKKFYSPLLFKTVRLRNFPLFSLASFRSATPGFSTQPPPQLPLSPPPLRRCQWAWQQTSNWRERVGHSSSPAVEARPPLNHRAPRKEQERAWSMRIAPHRMHRLKKMKNIRVLVGFFFHHHNVHTWSAAMIAHRCILFCWLHESTLTCFEITWLKQNLRLYTDRP